MLTKAIFSFAVLSLAAPPLLAAQEVVTDPVGFMNITVSAQSDAVLAIPIHRASAGKGRIKAIQFLSSSKTYRITAAGYPEWIAGQLVPNPKSQPARTDSFAVLIATGEKEGLIGKIIANTESMLTVEFPEGESLEGVKSIEINGEGDEFDVLPFWSLASLFRSNLSPGSQVLLMPSKVAGMDLMPESVVVFDGANWLLEAAATGKWPLPGSPPLVNPVPAPAPNNWTGLVNTNSPSPSATSQGQTRRESVDHAPLPFGCAFILRNNSTQPQVVSMAGAVPMTRHRKLIKTLAAGVSQDNWIGLSSPVKEVIGTLNLGFSSGDELLVFDNTAPGKNKTASLVLSFNGAAWLQDGANVNETFSLQPGQGYVLRKKGTPMPSAFIWQTLPSYLGGG